MALSFKKFTWQSGAHTMFELKDLLKTAGWDVKSSSNGTTANTSDNIASTASLASSNSWYVMRMPADAGGLRREFMAYRWPSGDFHWALGYSRAAGFSGGTTSAAPTASDALYGNMTGGSNARTSSQVQYFDSTGSKYVVMAADNAAPYGFYLATFSSVLGTGTGRDSGYYSTGGFALDPLQTGTYHANDPDPYIILSSASTPRSWLRSEDLQDTSNNFSLGKVWGHYNDPSSPALNPVNWVFYPSAIAYRGSLLANPYSGKDDTCALVYVMGQSSSANHIKGTSSLMRWVMQARNTGDTLSTLASRDRIIVGHVALPWDGTTPTF